MTIDKIMEIQNYLTVDYGDYKRTIIDLNLLLRRHAPEVVVRFLYQLLKEKEKALRQMIIGDKTSLKINDTVSFMFRIFMVIKILEREMEEIKCA
jgi:hypothetical protein